MTNSIARNPDRLYFFDYLRGLMVLYVVLDHAMHAYSPHFKKYWYIPDFGGHLLFDIWHMHNDIIMMPMLFFLAGLFVFPSLRRRGVKDFLREKMVRLGLPFIIGITILVPPQTYPKYLLFKDDSISYWNYLHQVYFFDGMTSSGFWFLYYLCLLTILLLVIAYTVPLVLTVFKKLAQTILDKPLFGSSILFLILAVILGLSDLTWGSPWWVGFKKVFYVRAARFIMKGFLFFLGAGFAEAGLLENTNLLKALEDKWKIWVGIALIAGAAYMSFALMNFYEPTGPYNVEVRRHFFLNGTWFDLWPTFFRYAPAVLIKTTLMALFLVSLMWAYLTIFKRFLNKPLARWQSLAACSYGIYIIHEPMVIWIHYYFYQSDVHEIIKFVLAALVPLVLSWWAIRHVRVLPGFKKVL